MQIICRDDKWSEILCFFKVFLPCNVKEHRLILQKTRLSMQKRFLSLASLLILVAILHINCSKDDDSAPPAKTKTELITKSAWNFDKATAGGLDVSSAIDDCFKDNSVTFATNKTGSISEGANVCSPSSAGNFSWEFQGANESTLHLSAPIFTGGSNDFTIVSLTETSLIISQVMTIPPYPATTVEITFKH
jgi:hypothetical protein